MRVIWFWLLLFIPSFIIAQEKQTVREIIHLKDGSVLFGEIMEWKQGEYLKLRMRNEIELTIPAETISKVVMKEPRKSLPDRLNKPGIYGGATIGLGFAESSGAMMVDGVLGYRIKPMVQLGMGIGAYRFNFDEFEHILPLFLEMRSDFTEHSFGPYTLLRVGSGFGISDDFFSNGERKYKPGFLVSPIAGLRLGRIGEAAFALEAGYIYYSGHYTEDFWGNIQDTSFSYQRWLFRLAIGF